MSIFKKKKINILVTGAKGQLGSYLVDYFHRNSFMKHSFIGQVFGIDIDELDITDYHAVADFFNKNVVNPSIDIDYVIHCAAATDTAAIEKDPAKFYPANVLGPKNIATSCFYNKIKLVFISTDYVLSEHSDTCIDGFVEFPVNAYGIQKLLAEREVEQIYSKRPGDLIIARSSWMFGNSSRSFIEKLLCGISKTYSSGNGNEKPLIHKVVSDAYGRPTHVKLIARSLMDKIFDNYFNGIATGTFDCQPNLKQISRYDWAIMIQDAFKQIINDDSLNAKIPDDVRDVVKSIKLDECSQNDFGGMRHPGLVGAGTMLHVSYDFNESYYSDITLDYIKKNLDRLCSMMHDVIESTKHKEDHV